MLKRKSILGLVLAICLMIPSMFMLSACGDNDPLLGTWKTYQVVTIDGDETTTINIGDTIGDGVLLSSETYQFTFHKDGTTTLNANNLISNGTWVKNADKTITGIFADPESSKENEIIKFTLAEDGSTLSAVAYEEGNVGETGYSKMTIILNKGN